MLNNSAKIAEAPLERGLVQIMQSEINRATSALWSIPCPTDYDSWFKLLCAAKSAGVTKEGVVRWCESGEGFKPNEFEIKWKSIEAGVGIGAGSLFQTAFDNNWHDPDKTRIKTLGGRRPSIVISKHPPNPAKPVKKYANANTMQVWERCIPATPAEAYIHKKQGTPDGLRVYPTSAEPLFIGAGDDRINAAGGLVIPCYAPDGVTLNTVQIIPLVGQKKNIAGASFGDGYFTVGQVTDCAYLVEGIGQGWAIHAATKCAAVVSFGSGRMATVAKALRNKFPSLRLVIVPDKGMEDKAAKIARDVDCEWVAMPADKPSNYDANDYLLEHSTSALSDLLECATKPPIEYPLSVAFADELTSEFTPPDEIVEGVLTAGDGSILYGDSNSGKTFFVIDMSCAVARGVPWMGKQTEPGLVIYVAAESPASVRSRIQAYQRHYGVRVPNFAIVQSPIDLFDGDADTDKLIQLVKQIERQKGKTARLIIGDTLARLSAGANENAGQDMGLVVRRFDRIRSECNAHFLLIHHSGKNAAAGARGWSGVRAAVDTEIEVTDSPTGRCCEITKQRDLSTKGDRIGFKLQVVTMGLSKWKNPVSSCVVMPADAPDKQTGKRISEVGGAIVEMLRTKGTGVKKKDVVAHFAERYDKSSVYRELKKLVAGGMIKALMGTVSIEVPNGAN